MNELSARTGRVQSWIDDPTSRLPVSCTVFVVEDEMEGPNGIEASWRFVSHALRFGAGVAVHLSKLRPKGDENGKGLVASGPISFAKIYSTLNEVLRRGGIYKNGAVVCHLDLNHPDILDFITADRADLPWVKRCVNINPHWWTTASQAVKDALIVGIKRGDIWLNKTKVDAWGRRIRGNVCLEVYLPSRGTCLLQHVNLGACNLGNIQQAFADGMTQLCSLHSKTNVGDSGEYLPSGVSEVMNEIVIGIDTSGSIGGAFIAQFLGEVKGIVDSLQPELVRLLYWDTKVCKEEVYLSEDFDNIIRTTKPEGGGGTDPRCVTQYMETNGIKPECVVMLTDGYVGSWGGEWSVPVLWCVLNNKSASPTTGQVVHINI